MSRDTASRYRLLLEINNAIVKHTDRKTLFQALATEIRKIVPYDRISINIYDPHTKSLSYFSIAEGVSAQGLEDENRPLAKGAIAQEVIRSRRPLIIPDLNQRSYWASVRSLLQAGLTASMAFPLITRGGCWAPSTCPSSKNRLISPNWAASWPNWPTWWPWRWKTCWPTPACRSSTKTWRNKNTTCWRKPKTPTARTPFSTPRPRWPR